MADELTMNFYLKFNLSEKSYYKSLVGVAIRGYRNKVLKIIEDKVNKENKDLVLSEIDDFVKPYQNNGATENGNEVYNEIMTILTNIKNVK